MRTLTRRGLMTGAVAALIAPAAPQFLTVNHGQAETMKVPAAAVAGFTLGDVLGAVEALKAANVPPLHGYYWARYGADVEFYRVKL